MSSIRPRHSRGSFIGDMAAATHANVLRSIRDGQADVRRDAQATNESVEGYLGPPAGGILSECHAAIAVERDQAQIVTMLRTAIGALTLISGGDAAAARDRARNRLRVLLQALEARP
jgi:hypothetical protein